MLHPNTIFHNIHCLCIHLFLPQICMIIYISCLHLTQIKLIILYTFNNTTINKCLYEVAFQYIASQLATGYSQLLYTIASLLLCYISCVLGHQQKSSYVPAMVAQLQLVFTILRALILPVKYTTQLGPAKKTTPMKAVSHNLHYHIISFV